MHKRKIVIVLAVLIALVPFLGFPGSWEDFFVMAGGVLIALLTIDFRFLRRKKSKPRRKGLQQTDVYVENVPQSRPPEESKVKIADEPAKETEVA